MSIPGPKGLPIIGISLDIKANIHRYYDYLLDMALKYGQSWSPKYNIGEKAIYITEHENVKHILIDNWKNYNLMGNWKDMFKELLGENIFTVSGLKWEIEKELRMPLFSPTTLKDLFPSMFAISEDMINVMDGRIELQDLMIRTTTDLIFDVFLDIPLKCIEYKPKILEVLNRLMEHPVRYRMMPWWKIARKLKIGHEKKFSDDIKYLNSYIKDIVTISKRKSNIVNYILDRPYSEIRDIVVSLIFGGKDILALWVVWAVYELIKHPSYIELIRKTIPNELTYKIVNNMPLLDAFLLETMRLHPTVPIIVKSAERDDILPTGIKIKKNDALHISPYVLNRIGWKDPDKFLPRRWLDGDIPDYKFTSFLAGPKKCIGKQLSFIFAKLAIIQIITKKKISLAPNQNITYGIGTALHVKDGMWVQFENRY